MGKCCILVDNHQKRVSNCRQVANIQISEIVQCLSTCQKKSGQLWTIVANIGQYWATVGKCWMLVDNCKKRVDQLSKNSGAFPDNCRQISGQIVSTIIQYSLLLPIYSRQLSTIAQYLPHLPTFLWWLSTIVQYLSQLPTCPLSPDYSQQYLPYLPLFLTIAQYQSLERWAK